VKTTLHGMSRGNRSGAATADLVQFAALEIGGQTYALDIMRIKGIYNPLPITPVPRAPAFIEGVTELRGAILPVVDLRKRFDAPPIVNKLVKFVLVALEGRILALIVDGVVEVMRVARADVRAAPAMASGESSRYFSGVLHNKGRIIMVVDLDAILTSSERVSLAGVTPAAVVP
jgi:purine-binding chemotaxis protein CheW